MAKDNWKVPDEVLLAELLTFVQLLTPERFQSAECLAVTIKTVNKVAGVLE